MFMSLYVDTLITYRDIVLVVWFSPFCTFVEHKSLFVRIYWRRNTEIRALHIICTLVVKSKDISIVIMIIYKQGEFFSFFCMYFIQHCFICRPSDSTVPEDPGIEPRTVATFALAVKRSNHAAISLMSMIIYVHFFFVSGSCDLSHTSRHWRS